MFIFRKLNFPIWFAEAKRGPFEVSINRIKLLSWETVKDNDGGKTRYLVMARRDACKQTRAKQTTYSREAVIFFPPLLLLQTTTTMTTTLTTTT